ncbi:hypothetical protein PMAYCL1PPCAC_06651, partial [Pristionchus mayeri]
SLSSALHGDSHSIRILLSTTKTMTAKSDRYNLRSGSQSQRNNDDYETPRMEEYIGSVDNAQFSQSDLRFDSQMENFLSESFGSRFHNLNSTITDNDFAPVIGLPKEDPFLSRHNYVSSQEKNIPLLYPHDQEGQFIPMNEGYQAISGPTYQDDDIPGGFAYSQDRNNKEEYTFTVALMPLAKSSKGDYVTERNLLFCKFMEGIPLNFSLVNPEKETSIPFPPNMFIRMSLRFLAPDSDEKAKVRRCHLHMEKDIDGSHKMFPFKLNHKDAAYDDANLSVTIPTSTVVSATFYCYSSCAGGIDRKPVYLLFELLYEDGSLYQQATLAIKVCANPQRDAPKEIAKMKKQEEKGKDAHGIMVERERELISLLSGVKSEGSCETEKRGRKRKTGDRDDMGRAMKRMESTSPMQPVLTPSPGWNIAMSAPRVSSRRNSKLEIRPDGAPFESTESSRKTSYDEEEGEDEEDKVFQISIQGKKKFEKVQSYLRTLEREERYTSRNDEDNVYQNLSQTTGEISISTWLEQCHLDEQHFLDAFHSKDITLLKDLNYSFTPTLFHSELGLPKHIAARLNKIYLNWRNGNACGI